MLAEFGRADGTFAGSIDADNKEGEGLYYTYSWNQARTALPGARGDEFLSLSNFSKSGNCSGGRNLPYFTSVTAANDKEIVSQGLSRLRVLRALRPRPQRNERVIAAWNGMAISALVDAHSAAAVDSGQKLAGRRYLAAAQKAGHSLLQKLFKQGKLAHAEGSNDAAFLDDYAFVEKALLDLYEADHDQSWLKLALQMNETVFREYVDNARDSFTYAKSNTINGIACGTASGTASGTNDGATDGTVPSGAAAAVVNIVRLAKLRPSDDSTRQLAFAQRVLQSSAKAMQAVPQKYPSMLIALDLLLQKR